MDTDAAIEEDEHKDYQHDPTQLQGDGLHNLYRYNVIYTVQTVAKYCI